MHTPNFATVSTATTTTTTATTATTNAITATISTANELNIEQPLPFLHQIEMVRSPIQLSAQYYQNFGCTKLN